MGRRRRPDRPDRPQPHRGLLRVRHLRSRRAAAIVIARPTRRRRSCTGGRPSGSWPRRRERAEVCRDGLVSALLTEVRPQGAPAGTWRGATRHPVIPPCGRRADGPRGDHSTRQAAFGVGPGNAPRVSIAARTSRPLPARLVSSKAFDCRSSLRDRAGVVALADRRQQPGGVMEAEVPIGSRAGWAAPCGSFTLTPT